MRIMEILRAYDQLENYLKPGKVLLVYGPRRAGKTTLLRNYLKTTQLKYKLDTGDDFNTQQLLGAQDLASLLDYVRGFELYAIDEAQRVPNIGFALKMLVDQRPDLKIIATGSASFELAGQIGEPLTGRKRTLTLYPISQLELANHFNRFELRQQIDDYLVYGSYPEILQLPKNERARELQEMTNSYLLKDILEFEQVKSSKLLLDLLRLIAFQIGGEVSLTELADSLNIDYKTVGRYLDLFEKAFVLYNVRGFSRNLRSEITKKSKYYFFDNGIRNAVISNFNGMELRDDLGKLWENFLVSERLKTQEYAAIYANNYFWRTWEQKEVDWVEEREGKLVGFEFKYSPKKAGNYATFLETYPEGSVSVVNNENYLDFLVPNK